MNNTKSFPTYKEQVAYHQGLIDSSEVKITELCNFRIWIDDYCGRRKTSLAELIDELSNFKNYPIKIERFLTEKEIQEERIEDITNEIMETEKLEGIVKKLVKKFLT